jgi:hypothetical protein
MERLNGVQRFLETHEKLLPVRCTWLAWRSLVQLSKDDVLTLARARDRLLERLFHNGLRPEQDLPSFLRFSGQPTSQRFRAVRQWMTNLCSQAHAWIQGGGGPAAGAPTVAYTDLVFAFGLARLGETDASRELRQRAQDVLGGMDDVHQFLLQAYDYRIKQALEGRPHSGPLPAEQMEYLEHMDRMPRYLVDRLRQHSHILEPEQKIDPYRYWGARINDLEKALAELADLTDRKEIIDRVQKLLAGTPKGAKGNDQRARILRAGLDLAPRVSEEFAQDLLDRTVATYDAMPEAQEQAALLDQAALLEKGMTVAAHFDRHEHIQMLVARFQKLLQSQRGGKAVQSLDQLAAQCFRGLRKLGMRDEIDQLLRQMAEIILEGKDVAQVDVKALGSNPPALRVLLSVASGWLYFGRDRQAEPILNAARAVLFKGDLPPKESTTLAMTYAATVGQAPVEAAQRRLEEIFQKLQGIRDTYTTNTHYGLSQLDVVEAVIRAVVNDDFSLGANARRWLDDDEFLVRRRIHRDVRELMAQTHS